MAGSQPLVTIVTPSYNQGRFIRATIESVLAQDYPHIEYIILDAVSTDETARIAAEYAGRLEFISEKDRGQSHAINKGFQRARGEIVAWINSDDTLLPGAVSRAVAALAAHPEAAASYGEGYLMDEEGFATCRFPHTQPFDLWRLINVSDYILQQSVFFRRSAVEAVGWIREDLHYAMDWDLLIRLGLRWPLHYEPAYFGCLREYAAAKTSAGGGKRAREILNMLREHSGRRWPEGGLVYGLDAYASMVRDAIARRLDGWSPAWSERAQILMHRLLHATVGFVLRDTAAWHNRGGWFLDGLCTADVFLALPSGSGTLILEGGVPESAWLEGQHLTIDVNGERLGTYPVGGRYRLVLPLNVPRDARLVVGIRAALEIVPNYDAPHMEGGFRRIAFELSRVEWNGWEYLPDTRFRQLQPGGVSRRLL